MSEVVTTTPGLITKLSEIQASSYEVGKENVKYIFDMQCQHDVPVNGRVRVILPDASAMNSQLLRNNCYRLDFAQRPLRVNCEVNELDNYFDILVASNTFGS